MSSLEALEYFVALCTLNFDKSGAKKCCVIKKDLEILEILKKKMTIETDYYDSDVGCKEFEYIAYNGEPLNIETQEEFDLLKEWIDDNKQDS